MGELSYLSVDALAHVRSPSRLRQTAPPFGLAALGVLGLGAANGGYFSSSWGWALVAFAAVLVWAVTVGTVTRPAPLETAFLGGLLLLAGWYALSALWGVPSAALEEAFRALVYPAGAAAAFAVVRRGSASALLGGVLTGATAVAAYALATRLFPQHVGTFDSVAGYRLATPIGYWNALGLLCAVALLLAAGLAASAESPLPAALAAAPAPLLATTLYFTFGRGAWISLAFGVLVALALDPRRLRLTGVLLALGIPAGIGVAVGSRSQALTHLQATAARAAQDGHRLAALVAVLAVVSALFAAGLVLARRSVSVPARVSRAYALALLLAALLVVVVALVRVGGPASGVHRAWHSFSAPPPASGPNLNKRLFSFSGTGRADLYRAAWHQAKLRPLLGGGAGSFEAYWLRHRPTAAKVRDAHSLYLETLAELGIVGLVLLVLALGAPLVGAVRSRARPGVAAAAGAYGAYLLGASADWDWEIAALTLAAILVGVAILASGRSREEWRAPRRFRLGLTVGAAAVAAAGFVFLVGNMFLSRAASAAGNGNWTAAAHDARRAASWLPWSTAPRQQLGEAQLGAGDTRAAQVSLRTALRQDPGNWNLWLDLARASTGAVQADALAHATRLDPLSPEVAELKAELASQGSIVVTGAKG